MKVYAAPEELEFSHDFTNPFSFEREQRREAEHLERLRQWAVASGYCGKRTGEILRIPHADGCAQYMYAENAPRRSGRPDPLALRRRLA